MTTLNRRDFIREAGAVTAALIAAPASATRRSETVAESERFGLIGSFSAVPGKRDELIAILLGGSAAMPGCLSYIVAKAIDDPDRIWITEIWESREMHQNSLALPSVQQAIREGRPLIAGFGERFETVPIGGQGLAAL